MRPKGGYRAGLIFVALVMTASLAAGNQAEKMFFGHISYIEPDRAGEAPCVFREGFSVPEPVILNLPLGPGDIIQTFDGPRCEVQFDNGTIVRLDRGTKLKIETLQAPSLSTAKNVSNLLLARGQAYVMYKKHNPLEIFQVITPQTAVKLNHNAVALIEVGEARETSVQVERGKVHLLYGPDAAHLHQKKIEAGERWVVSGDSGGSSAPADLVIASDFLAWNRSVNENFAALHTGSFLPKPLQHLPPAVFNFAQRFGNRYGEWVWHDLYGYVWRPFFNDRYPWGTWAPYIYGNWVNVHGQLFWVPEEPWGWVPYHLGIWMWDKNKGWVWLPGSMFAPAWAVWDFYFGYYSWRPWSLWDWVSFGGGWTMSANGTFWPAQPGGGPAQKILTSVSKDQLKRKTNPALPLPKDLKKSLNAAMNALRRGDENAFASLRQVGQHAVVLSKKDLAEGRWQERMIGRDRLGPREDSASVKERPEEMTSSPAVSLDVQRTIQRRQLVSEFQARLGSAGNDRRAGDTGRFHLSEFDFGRVELFSSRPVERRGETGESPRAADPSGRPALRFRDWNPDIRTGLSLGLDIRYDSRRNEVVAPELGLRSSESGLRMRAWEGGFSGPPSLGGEGMSSGTSNPGQGHMPSPAPHSSGSSPHAKESSSGRGEGKVN